MARNYQLSIKYQFIRWLYATTLLIIKAWFANFAFSITSFQTIQDFASSINFFIFWLAAGTFHSFHWNTTIKHTACSLKFKRWIAIRANSFLMSNASFFNFLANSIFCDKVSTLTGYASEIWVGLAIFYLTMIFRFNKGNKTLKTWSYFLFFTPKNFVP